MEFNSPKCNPIPMTNSPPTHDAIMELSPCSLSTPKSRKTCREGGEEEEGHGAGTNTNKRRKSNAIVTPRKSNAVVTPRKRGSKNNTPKKNASANGITGATSPDAAQKIDLRLEAKLSAEENAKMFAGRQIHPFFSSWKVARKLQELADPEQSLCTARRKGGSISCGPIHVFEDIKDDTSSLDWSDWTFLVKTTTADHGPESSSLSILEGSVGSLNFDKLLGASQPSNASISQNVPSCSDQLAMQQDNPQEIPPSHSAVLAHDQTTCPAKPENVNADMEVDEVSDLPVQMGIFRKSDTEPLSRFLHESMRPYYHSCKDKAEECLWTDKYKPTKASEVCGNHESVSFLHEWLRLWRERRSQRRKDSSNRGKGGMQDDDDDYDCPDSDCDSKDINQEDSLQNVLLLTGPVGSGKSAAVYACAQEQGFEVLELNTSDWRNGTAVKQYFGDALGSHGFKRSLEHTLNSPKNTVKSPRASALPLGNAAEETNDGVIELISDDEAQNPGGTPGRLDGKNHMLTCDSFHALILVEDVDILFPEDRGCIAAIQHIAETAKGPIILTSRSNKAGLPNNFDRLHVSFSLPLPDELFCHLYMVCVSEEVNINPLLLQRFVQSCNGDIRKTIMNLQFWFQSKKYRDMKVQTVYGSLPFDLEAGHQILQKIIPWDFPSELSKLIEREVAKSVSIMEENTCLQGLVKNELQINENKIDLNVQYMGADDYMEDKKVEMIKRNISFTNSNEFESPYGAISELSNCSGFPAASSWQKDQRNLAVVSSYSEDKDPNNGHCPDAHIEVHKTQSHEGNWESPSKFQLNQSYTSMPVNTGLNETCKEFDLSCMPESTFVPETAVENGLDTMSGAVSSGCLAGPAVVSFNNDSRPFTFGVYQSLANSPQNSDLLVNAEIPESSPKLAVQDFPMETTTVCNVIDECSHDDLKLKYVVSNPSMETDMVQDSWRKFRDRMDLRQHATSELLGVVQVVKLTSGVSNLMSEADLLFRNHQQEQCGIMEPPTFLSDEATISWYDEQMMMYTVALHGFCFYAKNISEVGSKLGCENRVDLTSEMLASTPNVMALGKLSRQDHTESMRMYSGKKSEVNCSRNDTKSENKTSLFNVIRSIVPARLSLALKGTAFNEYLSSLRQISMSEGFRISKGVEKKRGRRPRSAQHYLSRGTMKLSPEDISLVCEGDLYRRISSQYLAKVESNCS